MGCGSSNAAGQLAQQQQQQQDFTNQSIANINNAFAGFTPQFYQQAGRAYTNWATPQLQQQYQQNKLNLVDKLSGQGLLNSSAAQQANNSLSQGLTQGQQQIANQALTTQQGLQTQVGQEKSNLYSQAQTANNPQAIGQQALQLAQSTNAPSTFAPVGNLFNQFGQQYLAASNNNLYNQYANMYLNTLSNPAIYGQSLYPSGFSSLPGNVGGQ